jgi:hypothetical protein
MANLAHFNVSELEFTGLNRRCCPRREACDDRREMLRFEPKNPGRRSSLERTDIDRREEDNIWNNLHCR